MTITRTAFFPALCGKEKLKERYIEPEGNWNEKYTDSEVCWSGHDKYRYVLSSQDKNGVKIITPFNQGDIIDKDLINTTMVKNDLEKGKKEVDKCNDEKNASLKNSRFVIRFLFWFMIFMILLTILISILTCKRKIRRRFEKI